MESQLWNYTDIHNFPATFRKCQQLANCETRQLNLRVSNYTRKDHSPEVFALAARQGSVPSSKPEDNRRYVQA
jgi:hypothetical protein